MNIEVTITRWFNNFVSQNKQNHKRRVDYLNKDSLCRRVRKVFHTFRPFSVKF